MVVLTVIIVFISLLLIAVVLLQKSKGGGLAAGFQGSNQVLGAPKTASFLEQATWTMMGAVAILCIACTLMLGHGEATTGSQIEAQDAALPQMPENVATEDAPTTEAPATDAPAEAPVTE